MVPRALYRVVFFIPRYYRRQAPGLRSLHSSCFEMVERPSLPARRDRIGPATTLRVPFIDRDSSVSASKIPLLSSPSSALFEPIRTHTPSGLYPGKRSISRPDIMRLQI